MRPIDAEAFRRDIARMCVKRCHLYENDDDFPNCGECVANFIYEMLKKAPTIEAKPIVHAHWEIEYDEDDNIKKCYCSNCGVGCEPMNYCGFCGALMDEPISQTHENGVKIPVISMDDVPKIMEEMEK